MSCKPLGTHQQDALDKNQDASLIIRRHSVESLDVVQDFWQGQTL